MFLFSCGSETVENLTESKYSLIMVKTGEKIESDNVNYSGNGTKMTFGIGEKGELNIYELYSELSGSDIKSFEGKTYPGMVMFNDAKFDGEVLIESIVEEKDDNKSTHGTNYKIKGTFNADKGNKIKYAVSMFRMK
jgi:hypothetical protein